MKIEDIIGKALSTGGIKAGLTARDYLELAEAFLIASTKTREDAGRLAEELTAATPFKQTTTAALVANGMMLANIGIGLTDIGKRKAGGTDKT